jgi:hypothetical protein
VLPGSLAKGLGEAVLPALEALTKRASRGGSRELVQVSGG